MGAKNVVCGALDFSHSIALRLGELASLEPINVATNRGQLRATNAVSAAIGRRLLGHLVRVAVHAAAVPAVAACAGSIGLLRGVGLELLNAVRERGAFFVELTDAVGNLDAERV